MAIRASGLSSLKYDILQEHGWILKKNMFVSQKVF